jgi:hypothetical protein
MKAALVLSVVFTLGSSVWAQFYAPETEFHDIGQRTFPVEAARVLAWQRGAKSGRIASIDYRVETRLDRQTVWTILWLDGGGKPLRERTVRYDEALLTGGADYFREVFAQLCGEDWKIAEAASGDVRAAFWR